MRVSLTVVATMMVTVLGFSISDAEELEAGEPLIVKSAIYEIMDLWDHVKLGTAPYVSPQLFDATAVGYAYMPNKSEWNLILQANLYEYFSLEKYTFGKVLESGEIEVPSFTVGAQIWSIDGFSIDMSSKDAFDFAVGKWIESEKSDDWTLVGVLPELAGVAGEPIVAWEAIGRDPSMIRD